jgi:hypothetical protein
MCLDAAKIASIWEPFERENAGVLGASHSQLREEPPKRPPSDDGCLGTALDISGYRDAIVWQDFSAFPAISLMRWTSLDVLERYWMVGRVGIEPTTNRLRVNPSASKPVPHPRRADLKRPRPFRWRNPR